MITVVYPRKTIEDDLASVTGIPTGNPLVTAVNVLLKDGSQVWYAVSSKGKQALDVGGIQANAESLVVIQDKGGNKTGMTVGCDSISVNNAAQSQIKGGSFEFTVAGGSLKANTYVYQPLDLVDIYPESNVFYDQVNVTLQSKDEDTEIRYTLDSKNPDLTSTLYTGPITLRASTGIKARAFRKGVTVMPADNSCSQVSDVSIGYFQKTNLRPALAPRRLVNGMNYKYYEGYWKDLITFNDYVAPKKEGITNNVIDISPRETDDYFAFKYQGFIDMPKEGVYTFYAQDEFMKLIEDAGYELQVFVDGERWNPQGLLHGFGTWSIPLAKGIHSFEVQYMDYRSNNAIVNLNEENYNPFVIKFDRTGTLGEAERKNLPDMKYRDFVWNGPAPKLYISGPDIEKQIIPDSMLYREQ